MGVFGAGRIGRLHLRNVTNHRKLNLQWVVEDSHDAREATVEELFLHDTPFNASTDTPSLLADPR